jgi:hypothetical protein
LAPEHRVPCSISILTHDLGEHRITAEVVTLVTTGWRDTATESQSTLTVIQKNVSRSCDPEALGFTPFSIVPSLGARKFSEVVFDRGFSPVFRTMSGNKQQDMSRYPASAAGHDLCQLRDTCPGARAMRMQKHQQDRPAVDSTNEASLRPSIGLRPSIARTVRVNLEKNHSRADNGPPQHEEACEI